MKKFVLWITVLLRLYYHFTGFNLLIIQLSQHQLKKMLLNVFNKWCNWAGLIICIDKCSTFGIKKNGNLSTQFKQYLKVNNEVIPPVKLNETFTYFGKTFLHTMSVEKVKTELVSDFSLYVDV